MNLSIVAASLPDMFKIAAIRSASGRTRTFTEAKRLRSADCVGHQGNHAFRNLPQWPQWHVTLGEGHSRTLADLSNRVRNAAAHRRIMFSSVGRDLAGPGIS